MMSRVVVSHVVLLSMFSVASAADWRQFRGPGSLGQSADKGVPATWTESENVLWKTKLPGLGSSSPITVGDAIFLTCYSGYGQSVENPGEPEDLTRHIVCIDRANGKIRWTRSLKADLPESVYRAGNDSWHGYASSTPATDGERVYIFFGRSGVFCFDLTGKQLWKADVGTRTTGWGSATSPALYQNLVIVNASVESGAMVGLDKLTGKQVWRVAGTSGSWSSPILVETSGGKSELVLSLPGRMAGRIVGYDPESGKELWHCDGIPDGYVCPSAICHDGVVYVIGGRRNTAVAVRVGGRGAVEPLWRASVGSNVVSPVYYDGHLFWMHERSGTAVCLNAATGNAVYQERVRPNPGIVYASGILAGGKIYYVSQRNGTFVVAAKPQFELLAHNKLDDDSRTNASPAVDNGRLLIRTDRHLYCIGAK